MNAKFTPVGDRPIVELVCGRHDKAGKFHPENVKLTSVARLRRPKCHDDNGSYDWRNVHMPMIGYPSTDEGIIYNQMMRENREQEGGARIAA